MLNRQECYKLLFEIKSKGINTDEQLSLLSRSSLVPKEIIKFINNNRQLEVKEFYENLRKKYNSKSSKLYLQLVKEDLEPIEILKTLCSYNTQVILYSENLTNKKNYLDNSRIKESLQALTKYFNEQDISECIDILKIIKSDIKILENKE